MKLSIRVLIAAALFVIGSVMLAIARPHRIDAGISAEEGQYAFFTNLSAEIIGLALAVVFLEIYVQYVENRSARRQRAGETRTGDTAEIAAAAQYAEVSLLVAMLTDEQRERLRAVLDESGNVGEDTSINRRIGN